MSLRMSVLLYDSQEVARLIMSDPAELACRTEVFVSGAAKLPICPIDNLRARADAANYGSLTIPEQFPGVTLNFRTDARLYEQINAPHTLGAQAFCSQGACRRLVGAGQLVVYLLTLHG